MTANKRLTRKELRLFREQEKKEKQEQKKIRLLNDPDFQIVPRLQEIITTEKTPRVGEDPGSIMTKLLQWDYGSADRSGDWSWGQERNWSQVEWEEVIYPHFENLGQLTWAEVYAQRTGGKNRHKKNHDMALWDIHKEAFDRWLDIGLDQYETLFRFRIGSKPRIWGYKIHAKFFLIWWDREHKIYPTEVS